MSIKLPLKKQLASLAQVQELDVKIDQIKAEKDKFPGELKDLDVSITRIKKSIDEKNIEKNEFNKTVAQLKAALELNEDRSSRASAKMQAVTSGPEYQAAVKEVDQLKKMNDDFKAKLAAAQETMTKIDAEIEKNQTELTSLTGQRDEKSKSINERTNTLQGQVDTLNGEKTGFMEEIEVTIIRKYERVRMAKSSAMAPAVSGGRCGGCNMMVPRQVYNLVQKGEELHECPSCHRILFYPN